MAVVERFGPYELIGLLGRGGMGEVHRARDTRKNRGLVALKRLPAGLADDSDFQRRFLREAELAARLRDPHVIPIHDYGEIDGQPYLDMRLVDGIDLAGALAGDGPIDPARAVDIVGQVASALDAAHAEGLVHRDVKPQNVLLNRTEDGPDADDRVFVYLIDFGIAANLLASRRSSSVVSGTAAYMAPERFGGAGDHRVDVYALGCLLHELLTGRPPFDGDFLALMWAHVNAPPPRPSAAQPDVPAGFDDVVATAMAKEPEERYASAGALAKAARRIVREATALPAAPSPPEAHIATQAGPAPQAAPARPVRPDAGPQAEIRTVVPDRGGPVGPPTRSRRPLLIAVALTLVVGLIVLFAVNRGGRSPSTVAGPPSTAPPAPSASAVPSPVLARVALPAAGAGGKARRVALAPDGRRAYVAVSEGSGRPGLLAVVDTASTAVTATIPIATTPEALAVAPNGARVYVADYDDGTVSVVDTATDTVTARIPTPPTAEYIALTPDGRRAYVGADGDIGTPPSGSISVINTATNAVVATIAVNGAADVAAPNDRRVYATEFINDNPTLDVIDTASNTVISRRGDILATRGFAVPTDEKRFYVGAVSSDARAGTLFVTDANSGASTAQVALPDAPNEVVLSPDDRRVLLPNNYPPQSSAISLVDTTTNTVLGHLPIDDPTSVAFAPDGRRAYVTNGDADALSVVALP